MLRRFRPSVLVLMLVLATLPVTAASNPTIAGRIHGIEFCPQSICDAAIFGGEFVGSVNGRPAVGVFFGGITHDPLPEPGDSAYITGGTWAIRTIRQTFSGFVMPGGTLTNNGDNTFDVDMTLFIVRGGVGTLHFSGVLNHNTFPPTITGRVTQ